MTAAGRRGTHASLRRLLVVLSLLFLAGRAQARSIVSARTALVESTLDYLNIPYLWGGEHPQTGLDCSGFVQRVYRRAGLAVPRNTREQFKDTRRLGPEEVLPGDLLFFSMHDPGSSKIDHVGIYMGKGYFVHASVSGGIHVESIAKPYFLSRLIGIRKYRGF
mgnify:CR=1 FL=1